MNPKFSDHDWNFDSVPDEELVACCLWEYARESVFFVEFKQYWDSLGRDRKFSKQIGKGLDRIENAPQKTVRFLHAFLDEKKFPCPWQRLPGTVRRRLTRVDCQSPPPFQQTGSVTEAECLLNEAKKYAQTHRAKMDEVHRAHPGVSKTVLRLQRKLPRYEPKTSVRWDDGTESAIVQIAWEDYTDEELTSAFKAWAALNRPKGMGVASNKGKRVQRGYGSYLAWLGIMRLMHLYPFTTIEHKAPAAWKRHGRADWPRARKQAIQFFKTHFPFSAKDGSPLHSSTAGNRSSLVGGK